MTCFPRDGLPPHRGAGVTLGVELRSTAEVSRRVTQAEKEFDVSGSPDAQLTVGHGRSTTVWLIQSPGCSLIHLRSAIACSESLAGLWKVLLMFGKISFTHCLYNM
ncbi:unnamed protein product [Strongylus vulgaris]|uniref:Uncharacterized protein n=1 Tax=Strongylus vulgaris TaxID=40348 RepID=A0A3P7KH28_STRVU|nr:unnamed protein product [Strongylus vulgaris]